PHREGGASGDCAEHRQQGEQSKVARLGVHSRPRMEGSAHLARHMPREHEQESRSTKVLRWCAARLLLSTLTDEFAFRRISRIDVRVLPIQIEHHWQDIAASTPPPSDLSADQNGRRFRYTQERVTERVS